MFKPLGKCRNVSSKYRFDNRLTRSLLRSTTLSTASGKEGLEKFFYPLCGVAAEGGPAKRRRGESVAATPAFAEIF